MHEIDVGSLPQWGQLIFGFLGFIAGAWAWVTKRAESEMSRVMKQALANKERLDRHENRLVSLEEAMRHLPTRQSVEDLRIGQERLQGALNVALERLAPLAAIAERMQEILISGGPLK